MPSAASAVRCSTNREIARQAASNTDVSTFHDKQDSPLRSSGSHSVAFSMGFWPCCGQPVEFGGCTSDYHVELVDEMEPEGAPKGKEPIASRKSDDERKVSKESAEHGPSKRSHLSTSSTSAPMSRGTSTTTLTGSPPESLLQGESELPAQLEMDPLSQGEVMPPDPNRLTPVHQDNWRFADPQEWGVLDSLDPWFNTPKGNVGSGFNHTLEDGVVRIENLSETCSRSPRQLIIRSQM